MLFIINVCNVYDFLYLVYFVYKLHDLKLFRVNESENYRETPLVPNYNTFEYDSMPMFISYTYVSSPVIKIQECIAGTICKVTPLRMIIILNANKLLNI